MEGWDRTNTWGGGRRTVWGTIQNALELAQNRAGEATVTLNFQVLKIEEFTKTIESLVQAFIIWIKELTYVFSQLHFRVEHL